MARGPEVAAATLETLRVRGNESIRVVSTVATGGGGTTTATDAVDCHGVFTAVGFAHARVSHEVLAHCANGEDAGEREGRHRGEKESKESKERKTITTTMMTTAAVTTRREKSGTREAEYNETNCFRFSFLYGAIRVDSLASLSHC